MRVRSLHEGVDPGRGARGDRLRPRRRRRAPDHRAADRRGAGVAPRAGRRRGHPALGRERFALAGQDALHHPVHPVARQRVDEVDLARHLVVGEPLGGRRRSARPRSGGGSPRTTTPRTSSPSTGFGIGTTATSTTPGCSSSTPSTSAEEMLRPPRRIICLLRSTKKRKPSSSSSADVAGVQPAAAQRPRGLLVVGRRSATSCSARARRARRPRRAPPASSVLVAGPSYSTQGRKPCAADRDPVGADPLQRLGVVGVASGMMPEVPPSVRP